MLRLLPTVAPFLCMQFGETALMLSSVNGHVDIAKLLVQHGADMTIKDKVSRAKCDCGLVMRG